MPNIPYGSESQLGAAWRPLWNTWGQFPALTKQNKSCWVTPEVFRMDLCIIAANNPRGALLFTLGQGISTLRSSCICRSWEFSSFPSRQVETELSLKAQGVAVMLKQSWWAANSEPRRYLWSLWIYLHVHSSARGHRFTTTAPNPLQSCA